MGSGYSLKIVLSFSERAYRAIQNILKGLSKDR